MRAAFRIVIFFLILAGISNLLTAQTSNAVFKSPHNSSAAIDQYPLIASDKPLSRLISLREQAVSVGSADNAAYQVIISCNTESYSGYIGPRLQAGEQYSISNQGSQTFKGKTAHIGGLAAGDYTLSLHLDGYQDLSFNLTVANGRQYLLDIIMEQRSGWLDITADQKIQDIEVDGASVGGQLPLGLSEGRHRVRVRSFAFADYLQSIFISENMVTHLDIHFVPAVFHLSSSNVSRTQFRPFNTGSLGTSTISFTITSFGSAVLTITNSEGTVVSTKEFLSFSTWTQRFTWDGRTENGETLSEGPYKWNVSAQPADGVEGETETASGSIIIDYASFIKFRSQWSGLPGLDFVSDTYTLAPTSLQIGSRLVLLSSGTVTNAATKFLVSMDFRYGIYRNLEFWFNASGDLEVSGASSNLGVVGGGAAWSFLPLPAINPELNSTTPVFGAKLNLMGAGLVFAKPRYPFDLDEAGQIPGGRIGIATQMRIGIFSLLLEPAIHLSAWPFHLEASGTSEPNGLPVQLPTFFGSLHGGIYFDSERLLIGLSTAIYTTPDFMFQLPMRTGLTIQLMPVESFIIGLDFQIKLGKIDQLEPSGGLSIGFIQ